jgi:hypothetical protein
LAVSSATVRSPQPSPADETSALASADDERAYSKALEYHGNLLEAEVHFIISLGE